MTFSASAPEMRLAEPVYAATPDGPRLSRRACTHDYKIMPIRRAVRELMGKGPRSYIPPTSAVQWLGISTDEWHRQKDSGVKWVTNRWPLMELGMSRADCLAWWREHYPDQPLSKSACVGCPFHSNATWVELMRTCPDAVARTMELDERLRDPRRPVNASTKQYAEYLHRSLRPLREVLPELVAQDEAQLRLADVDGMGNECEGHCGL